jgi:hypothetical protein
MGDKVTLECGTCGKKFSATTEQEAKKLRMEHSKKQHNK